MRFFSFKTSDWVVTLLVFISLSLGVLMLWSIAPQVFPQYFLYIVISIIAFFAFSKIDFTILMSFSSWMYIACLIFLILPLFIGESSRGATRWIVIGQSSLQPTELVRPFLILFFATFLTEREISIKRIIKALFLLSLPLVLIFLQPSLGVTILTAAGFFGALITLRIDLKVYLYGLAIILVSLPIVWLLMAPYQRGRILAILHPTHDPTGASYNSIQSMIAVGSGELIGRGLGHGVQTQLSFLPEKHNDFIFASTAEELGLLGATLLLIVTFILLYRLLRMADKAESSTGRAYITGIFLSLFLQVSVHVGMNMGLFPITGLPFPLVSYGGSSLLSTMIMYGIALQASQASATIHHYEIRSITRPWHTV